MMKSSSSPNLSIDPEEYREEIWGMGEVSSREMLEKLG